MQCKQIGEVGRWSKWCRLDTWLSGGLADTNDTEYCVGWDENPLLQKILHKWVSSQLIFWRATDSQGFKMLFPAKYLFLLLNSMPWILSQAGREQMSSSEVCEIWQRQVLVFRGPMQAMLRVPVGRDGLDFRQVGSKAPDFCPEPDHYHFRLYFFFKQCNLS